MGSRSAVGRGVWCLAFGVLPAVLLMGAPTAGSGQEDRGASEVEFAVGGAYFDVDGDDATPALELGYHPGRWTLGPVRPQVGGMVNGDGGVYGYAGLGVPLEVVGGLRVSPSLAVGAYREGSSVELGSVLEFRSALRIDHPVRGDDRLAIFVYHLSNASIAERNPGVEAVGVAYLLRR